MNLLRIIKWSTCVFLVLALFSVKIYSEKEQT